MRFFCVQLTHAILNGILASDQIRWILELKKSLFFTSTSQWTASAYKNSFFPSAVGLMNINYSVGTISLFPTAPLIITICCCNLVLFYRLYHVLFFSLFDSYFISHLIDMRSICDGLTLTFFSSWLDKVWLLIDMLLSHCIVANIHQLHGKTSIVNPVYIPGNKNIIVLSIPCALWGCSFKVNSFSWDSWIAV